MFNLEEVILQWRQQMAAGGVKAPEVLDELESHLRDDVAEEVRAGQDEQQAFDAAVPRIGGSKALKKEFRKLKRLRDNPLWLNLLAVWLIVTGLSNLNLRGLVLHFEWSPLPILLGVGLTILGVGLLRRNNISRLCAIAWFAFLLIGSVIFMAKHGFSGSGYVYAPHIPASSGTVQYQVFGLFPAPYPVFYAVVLFNTAMWFVGLFLLTKPSIRKVFRQITT